MAPSTFDMTDDDCKVMICHRRNDVDNPQIKREQETGQQRALFVQAGGA